MKFENTLEFAQQQDKADSLKQYREKFYFPQFGGHNVLYFTGNSLGLQPKTTQDYVLNELEDWATFGVEGHFHSRKPWLSYHEQFAEPLAKLVGAKPTEVVAMNQLTVNLHLLLISFYQPTKQRYKILCEAKAFPSDQYALESQVRLHGFNPEDAIIEVAPREGEYTIRTEDILFQIEQHSESLALITIGGVNYFTGQVFDMETITKASHGVGAHVGFDLAHAAGNIALKLHDWNVDFACWCSYKYLNSGPGSVAGAFVHEKHHKNKNIHRLAGWWGHNKENRFKMEKGFVPIETAEAWQMSNAPILSMAAHKAALDIFTEVGMNALISKSRRLSDYLWFVIEDINSDLQKTHSKFSLEIITPKSHQEKGCQVSVVAHGKGKKLYEQLLSHGVVPDWREPNVIRLAPVPLYNNFEDVFLFGKVLKHLLINE
ncbi:MAG: kynureninase [Bacteroidetes bacterium]|nr:kynureninase [Bacteroidota bacterium]